MQEGSSAHPGEAAKVRPRCSLMDRRAVIHFVSFEFSSGFLGLTYMQNCSAVSGYPFLAQ